MVRPERDVKLFTCFQPAGAHLGEYRRTDRRRAGTSDLGGDRRDGEFDECKQEGGSRNPDKVESRRVGRPEISRFVFPLPLSNFDFFLSLSSMVSRFGVAEGLSTPGHPAARGRPILGVAMPSADRVHSGLGYIPTETLGIIPRTEFSTAVRASQTGHRASAPCLLFARALQRRRERSCAVWVNVRENPGVTVVEVGGEGGRSWRQVGELVVG